METENQTAQWKKVKELSKSGRSISFTAFLVKILPHVVLIALTKIVTVFYYAFNFRARKVSRQYQKNLIAFAKQQNIPNKAPKFPHTYRHITSFATCLVEKIEGWSGKTSMNHIEFANGNADVEEVRSLLKNKQGCMLFCSHLGNIELFRSIFSFGTDDFDHIIPVTIIMDKAVTQNFNDFIENLNSNAKMNVIAADDISMGTMEQLQDTIENGGLVVISADRVPAYNASRCLNVSFLGKTAKLPYGPFLIAALLNCPTFFIFSMRKHQSGFDPTYVINLIKSDISFDGGRKERETKIAALAARYAKLMEEFCLKYPYQWYNYYDFW